MNDTFRQCPFCSQEVPAKAVKCRHCGEFLQDFHPDPEMMDKPGFQSGPKKVSACLIVSVVLLLVLFVLGIGAYFGFSKVISRIGKQNEAQIVSMCKMVAMVQEQYYLDKNGYATLPELAAGSFVDAEFGTGRYHGQVYEIKVSEDRQEWGMTVWPQRPLAYTKSYYIDSTGEVRAQLYSADTDEKAGPDSALLWDDSDW